MNEQLIKFIELCLEDGVISDKEREVIFRKSKELGVPDDECEILLNSLVSKHSKKSNRPETPKKKGGFFSSMFNEIKNNIDTESIKSSLNKVKEDFQKGMENSMGKGPSIQNPKKVPKEKKHSIVEGSINESNKKDSMENYQNTMEININSILKSDNSLKDLNGLLVHSKKRLCSIPNYIDKVKLLQLLNPTLFKTTYWNKDINSIIRLRENNGEYIRENHEFGGKFEFGLTDGDEGVMVFNTGHPIYDYSLCLIGKDFSNVFRNGFVELHFELLKGELVHEYRKRTKIKYGYNQENDSIVLQNQNGDIINEIKFKSILIRRFLSFLFTEYSNLSSKIKLNNEKKNKLFNDKINLKIDEYKEMLLNEFDKDRDGTIDLFQGENQFLILFQKHKVEIQEKGDGYIHNLVKVSNYLEQKKLNIHEIFEEILKYELISESKLERVKILKNETGKSFSECLEMVENMEDVSMKIDEYIGLLKNQIHSWNMVFFHSINMIVSIVKNDEITFYEIYEKLDKLNIFNSNWENEISEKLKNIEKGIGELIVSIQQMEINIIRELEVMTYMTSTSIDELNSSVNESLKGINSSINFNTLLTGIQTYQMYEINKNTKSLRG